jgi:hypothetical protein
MSTEHHSHLPSGQLPHHETVSYEKTDVEVRSIYWYLAVLAISVALCFFVSVYILKYTKDFVSLSDPARMPAREAMGPGYHTMPPEPRLQGVPGHEVDPQEDRRNKEKSDREANEMYGWVDQKAGTARIPLSEAVKIIAEKGVTTTPEKKSAPVQTPGGPAVSGTSSAVAPTQEKR